MTLEISRLTQVLVVLVYFKNNIFANKHKFNDVKFVDDIPSVVLNGCETFSPDYIFRENNFLNKNEFPLKKKKILTNKLMFHLYFSNKAIESFLYTQNFE